jgi:hypothetical protein
MKRPKKSSENETETIQLDDQTIQLVRHLRQRFREQFGREPGPGYPVFFDPNAPEPRPLNPAEVATQMVQAMKAAAIPAELIYAYAKTGMLVAEHNEDRWSVDDLAEWRAAIEEYRQKQARGEAPT